MSTQGSTQATQGGGSSGPMTYTIAGVKVEFPTKAYPSQIAMMNQVIQGLKQGKNCLLESPTGSGKTLALLCAALAWQRYEADRVAEINAALDAKNEAFQQQQLLVQQKKAQRKSTTPNQQTACSDLSSKDNKNTSSLSDGSRLTYCGDVNDASCCANSNAEMFDLTEDEDDDFKPMKRTKSFIPMDSTVIPPPESSSKGDQMGGFENPPEDEVEERPPYFVPPQSRLTVPTIFFGTRTHKQIAQVTRELRKTFYKTSRSAILSSRNHACINPIVETLSNRNEACRELLRDMSMGGGCLYHGGAKKLGSFSTLGHHGIHPGYDLEDLVAAGRQLRACPYYATRFLMATADIIFCPYNYIIDPSIRTSMGIELANQVLIFDEAHNMEDASREASSFTIRQDELQKGIQDCEKVHNINGIEPYAHAELARMLSTVSVWLDCNGNQLRQLSFDTFGRFWTGTEAIASLHTSGLTEELIRGYEVCFKTIMLERDREIELNKERGNRFQMDKPVAASVTVTLVENVFRLFNELQKHHGRQRDDFRIALIKSSERRRRDGNGGPYQKSTICTLNVWCLNPAVAFADIRENAHAVILTSGTLSPMQSFESELGTPFPLKLEASHVIDKNQVWAGVVGVGPTNVNLNGSYQNAGTLLYQDEIGLIIQNVCEIIPYGVLCFFPSYRMLETMVDRWQLTNQYSRMGLKKQIIVEPRTGAADFERSIQEFYVAVKNGEENAVSRVSTRTNGALYLAVCRGKVSEGIDFSDNNARAVICIGIPFPNYRDMQVELKREYNQQNLSRGLLSGGDWYEIQAFRAVNQALGRCIRHRQDWGAILLIDDRYLKNQRYIGSLSKWMRSSVQSCSSWSGIPSSLEKFRDEMLSRPIPESSFGTQVNSASESSQYFRAGLNEGDINPPKFRGTVHDYGMNDGEDCSKAVLQQSHHFNGFAIANHSNSGSSLNGLDTSSAHLNSRNQLNFSSSSVEEDFNPYPLAKNKAKTRAKILTSPNFNTPAKNSSIAEMFARQRQNSAKSSNSFNQPVESSVQMVGSSSSNTPRNKRPREKKIKL